VRAGVSQFEAALDATPAIALVEADRVDRAMHLASACIAGGHRLVAVSALVPDFMELVRALVPRHDLLVGLALPASAEDAAAGFADGACFVLGADGDPAVGEAAREAGAVWLPGVLSPTEARAAQSHGATHAHVFPALAGAAMLAHLRRAAPSLALVVSGYPDTDAMESWLDGGARAVVLDRAIASLDLMAAGDMMAIRARAADTHREASRLSRKARGGS
jgi:2-keto-3-deoxy-6-phosphogluconate aldolase